MKRILFTILIFSIFIGSARCQMITTIPAVPTTSGVIKIIYDSSKDTGELHNFTSNLYAHTGVTVNGIDWQHVIGTWPNTTTQPKLNYLGNYLYEFVITPDIKTFYSLSSGEVPAKICLVIRNALGTKQTRPDIFINVFQAGINANFTIPDKLSVVAELNDKIPVKAVAILADSLSLYINGKYRKRGTTPSLVTDTLTADTYSEFWVKTIAWDIPKFAADSFFVNVRKPVVTAEVPPGMKDGINYTGSNSVTLVLHAPYKKYVFALGDFTGWTACDKGYMKRTPDDQRYWIEINGLEPGKEYRFQYLVDSALYIADPYASKVLDPWNDQYITSETYPDLIPYAKDTATGMVSVLQTSQIPYTWQVTDFQPPKKSDLIIYELLIRDFVAKHDFKTLIDTLNYLDNLGINAIELMPVSEFEGNLSWGYNPAFYFAPDKYYGPAHDMKVFVDSCHARGIAVIMDMVLNHSGGQSPFVQLYLDNFGSDQTYMKIPNPWFNASSPNTVYKWGADFNHESIWTQKLVDRVNAYWLTDFNIDGFRFDFTKGFTNTAGDGSGYDASRIAILKRMADQIWSVNPDAYVILEHFAPNDEEIELSDYGMMLWGNINYNYSEAAMGYPSDLSYASWLGRGWTVPNLVSYMESHDEERLMYKTITYGAATTEYITKTTQLALKRMMLDALFFLAIPGPKMIWQFGELGYDISIDFNGRTGEKPIKWDYFSDPSRHQLYMFYKLLNYLRNTQPVFSTGNYSWSFTTPMKRLQLLDPSMNALILGNFGIVPATINPSFPNTGKWYEYFSEDSTTVVNVNAQFSMKPGEFRLYTSKKLASSKIIVGINDNDSPGSGEHVFVYPNPSKDKFYFEIKWPGNTPVIISIFDLTGRLIRQIKTGTSGDSPEPVIWDGRSATGVEAENGLYIVQLRSGGSSTTIKIIKE